MTQMLSLAGRSCSGSRQSLPGLCSNKKGALRFAASFGFVSVLPTTQVLIAANRQSECDNCFGSSCVVSRQSGIVGSANRLGDRRQRRDVQLQRKPNMYLQSCEGVFWRPVVFMFRRTKQVGSIARMATSIPLLSIATKQRLIKDYLWKLQFKQQQILRQTNYYL